MTARTRIARLARRLARRGSSGYVDHFDAGRVVGWAFDPSDPGTPALLSLHVDGQPELNIIADMKREDVQAAGIGPLRSGFDTTLPRRLRDGRPHRVEIRLGLDGPLLRHGILSISADPGRADALELVDEGAENATSDNQSGEGVAFFDAANGAITGWAKGCTQVTVRFDGGTGQTVRLSREVPGFGTGSLQGFRLAVPARLRDGRPHRADVVFDRAGAELDGSPFSFTLAPERIFVEATVLKGTDLVLTLRDGEGRPAAARGLVLLADGMAVETRTESSPGRIGARLTGDCRSLVLRDAEGEILARFAVAGGEAMPDPRRELPAGALDATGLERARTAFDAFCADPGNRFDPLWYRWAHRDAQGLETPKALLDHYRFHAGIAAASPGPFFDEAAARALYPAVADAVAAGDLPCAFALELALGEGSLETSTGLAPEQRRALAGQGGPAACAQRLDGMIARSTASLPEPLIARQPAPVAAQTATDTVYAAWFGRLAMTPDQRAGLEQDEHRMRRRIAGTALTRAPLVTVIMPSWNRAFTIGEAIQSLIEQTYANWELIVCNDASEDRTADVVRGFDDPRIRFMTFLKSNGAGARNKGLGWARGEYIAYLDSDNLWHPQFLDMMIRRLLADPGSAMAYAAYLDTEMIGGRVELLDVQRPAFRPIHLNSRNFMDLNSIVHHRRLYDWMGGFDTALPRLQDWDLALRYTSVFRPIFVDHVGVFYRRNVAWGQVTHLFMDSGARDTVGEKTRRRLEERHERLDIPWPERGRITVLWGRTGMSPAMSPTVPGDRVLAENLARLAARVADVDLVELGGAADEAGEDPGGVTRHAIPAALANDLPRLGRVLGTLLRGRPVLSVGLRDAHLRAMSGLDPDQAWRLRNNGEGTVLQALGGPVCFDLGAVPMALPVTEGKGSAMLLLLPSILRGRERETLRESFGAEAQKRGLTLLVWDEHAVWQAQDRTGWHAAEIEIETGLPVLLGQCVITICPGQVSDLDPFGFALINALQARGVPAAVPQDSGRAQGTGFARQWIEAGAAYEIKAADPKWIFDKLRKLLADEASLARLQDRSRLVHAIAFHPDLARERLAHALYRLLHEPPHREVIDGR